MSTRDYKGLNERQRMLLDILAHSSFASIEEISEQLSVSAPTIRRDLQYFQKLDIIYRIRGGARIKNPQANAVLNTNRVYSMWMEKARIGKAAADLVQDGDLIAVNSGTTVMAFINNLREKHGLKIVLTDYEIALMITHKLDYEVIINGGKLVQNSSGQTGKKSVELLKSFYYDKCFVGVIAVNPRDGLMTSRVEFAEITRSIIENSNFKVLITDSTKFQKQSGAIIVPFDAMDMVITDSGINNYPSILDEIRKRGKVRLIIV